MGETEERLSRQPDSGVQIQSACTASDGQLTRRWTVRQERVSGKTHRSVLQLLSRNTPWSHNHNPFDFAISLRRFA
jgi:hypothetical protein